MKSKLFIIGNTTKESLIALKLQAMRFFVLGIIFLFTTGLFQSCQEKTSNKEGSNRQELSQEELTAIAKEIYFNDQKYRRLITLFEQVNSECKDAKVDLSGSKDEATRLAYELFWENLAYSQDKKNTERLIAITKKYGFPGWKHLDHDIPIFTVFIHAVKEEFHEKEIKELIKKEYRAGRVSEYEKNIIFWHSKIDSVFSSLKKSDSLFAFQKFLDKNPQLPIPHSINYRQDVEIFKGSLFYEKYETIQSGKEKKTNDIELVEHGLSRKEIIAEVKDMYFNDQEYRRVIAIFEEINEQCKGVDINPYNSEDDKTRLAYWLFREDVIEPQDRENIRRLMAITREYGFPGMKSLGHDIPIFMVFAHTSYQYEYNSEVRKLVKQEFKAGRISEFAKDYIFWHLNGRRTGTPPKSLHPINYRTDIEVLKGALSDK